VEIKIDGIDPIVNKLRTLENIEKKLAAWVEFTRIELSKRTHYTQTHPPRLPDQKYARTFALAWGWQTTIEYRGRTVIIRRFNRLPYAPDVMGDGTQTRLFSGRWPTESQIAQIAAPRIVTKLRQRMEQIVKLKGTF